MKRMRLLLGPLLLGALALTAGAQWLELKRPHYSVFYQHGYANDARMVERWADATERVMRGKYGVSPMHYRMSIFLHPTATKYADVDLALTRCCTTVSDSLSTGTIDMLTPSSSLLRSDTAISSLGMRKSLPDYSAKIFVSEYIPVAYDEVQRSRPLGGWRFDDAPN